MASDSRADDEYLVPIQGCIIYVSTVPTRCLKSDSVFKQTNLALHCHDAKEYWDPAFHAFCFDRSALFAGVWQMTSELIVAPFSEKFTKRILCLSPNTVHINILC